MIPRRYIGLYVGLSSGAWIGFVLSPLISSSGFRLTIILILSISFILTVTLWLTRSLYFGLSQMGPGYSLTRREDLVEYTRPPSSLIAAIGRLFAPRITVTLPQQSVTFICPLSQSPCSATFSRCSWTRVRASSIQPAEAVLRCARLRVLELHMFLDSNRTQSGPSRRT